MSTWEIKERPAVRGGGAGRIGRGASAFSRSYSTPKRPTCQAPVALRRWLVRARARAARDLAAAERARASGDVVSYYNLRRSGLCYQLLQTALEAALREGKRNDRADSD